MRWRCFNRLRVVVGKTKATIKQWGYVDEAHDTLCDCGKHEQTVQHLLQCRLLEDAVKKNLVMYNKKAHNVSKDGCT